MRLQKILQTSILSLGLAITGCEQEHSPTQGIQPGTLPAPQQETEQQKKPLSYEESRQAAGIKEDTIEYDLEFFERHNLPEEVAVAYETHFQGIGIHDLHKAGIDAKTANAYDDRYNADDILFFQKGEKLDDEAKKLTNLDNLNTYSTRFDGYSIRSLIRAHISSHVANAYDNQLGINEIIELHEAGITPVVANSYDRKIRNGYGWHSKGIIALVQGGVTPEVASKYKGYFDNSETIIRAAIVHFDPGSIHSYQTRIFGKETAQWALPLYEKGITPGEANALDTGIFMDNNVREWEVNSQRFQQMVALHEKGITPATVNRYAQLNKLYQARIDPYDVIAFEKMKIPFDELEQRVRNAMIDERITR
ncbi:MAG TPA: hypothetical protein VJB87_04235 [Candidatus Nanoarchaeia archaeon]|nr:hypothetical protein [Candidatus Nanoarchaeia archaeon]